MMLMMPSGSSNTFVENDDDDNDNNEVKKKKNNNVSATADSSKKVSASEEAERNFQLIENLMTRMHRMGLKGEERRKALEEDQKANSEMCSSKVPSLMQDMEMQNDGPSQRKPSTFLPWSNDTVAGGMPPEINVTFRSAAATEAGRRLDAKFEDEVGHMFAPATKKGRTTKMSAVGRTTGGAKARRSEQHKLDEKKQERIKYERRLQNNLEHYVTRAVNELRYETPNSHRNMLAAYSSSRRLVVASEAATATGIMIPGATPAAVEQGLIERWPIPIGHQEMNPRLLLSYSAERIVLPAGTKMFKHFVMSELSSEMYVYTYWFVHCRFYQEDSEKEQEHLLKHLSVLYVKLLSTPSLLAHRDFFFKYYPYLLANAVYWGFYYLCPGSRHLYTNAFRRVLNLVIVQIVTGLDVCPSSILVLQRRSFPEFIDHDTPNGEMIDGLPPLPHHAPPANAANGKPSKEATTTTTTADSAGDTVERKKTLHSIATTVLLAGRVAPKKKKRRRHTQSAPQLRAVDEDESASSEEEVEVEEKHSLPISVFTGSRAHLRFRPPLPENIESAIPRQRRLLFDTSRISPLLEQYLDSHSPKKHNRVCRTHPVSWCTTGGVETFAKTPSRKETHEAISNSYRQAKLNFKRDVQEMRNTVKTDLRTLDSEQRKIQRGGSVAIGRYALDKVVEINNNSNVLNTTNKKNKQPGAGSNNTGGSLKMMPQQRSANLMKSSASTPALSSSR